MVISSSEDRPELTCDFDAIWIWRGEYHTTFTSHPILIINYNNNYVSLNRASSTAVIRMKSIHISHVLSNLSNKYIEVPLTKTDLKDIS